MFIKKSEEGSINSIKLVLSGDEFISRFIAIFSIFCCGKNIIQNFSINKNSNELLNILKQFNIKFVLNEKSKELIIDGNGGFFNLEQSNNAINIDFSKENFIFLIIVLSNQNFKTFFTGNDNFINNLDCSFLKSYLKNAEFVFNKENKLPLLLFGKPNHCNENNFVVNKSNDKAFVLLNSLFNKNKIIYLRDEDLKDEFVESLFKYYGINLVEKYSETTNFITRDVRKTKDIAIEKNNNLKIKAKNFIVPASIKEAFYSIFIFLILDLEEICLENVAINEYNETIIKVLIDNGVNLQLKNQKILNNIKISDLVVKKSVLKPLVISKTRLKELIDYYPFIILLNIIKNNSITLMDITFLKKNNNVNYKNFLNLLNQNNFNVKEEKNNLEFTASEKNNDKMVIDDINNFDILTKLALFLSNIHFQNNIKIDNTIEIENLFPNIFTVLKAFNLETND